MPVVKRIVINEHKGGVKFAIRQGKADRFISTNQPALTQTLMTEGRDAVETEILKQVYNGEIILYGGDESITIFKKAWNEWKDFFFNSDKSDEVIREILRSIHNEIREQQSCIIKINDGYYAGMYIVNGKYNFYSTADIPDTKMVYFPNMVSANKVLNMLKQCENFEGSKVKIIPKTNKETIEGVERIADYLKNRNLMFEYTGYLQEATGDRITYVKKYTLANVSYKLEANISSNKYNLYFKGIKVLNCQKQQEIIDFIEEYCRHFPVNIGKSTKFYKLVESKKASY